MGQGLPSRELGTIPQTGSVVQVGLPTPNPARTRRPGKTGPAWASSSQRRTTSLPAPFFLQLVPSQGHLLSALPQTASSNVPSGREPTSPRSRPRTSCSPSDHQHPDQAWPHNAGSHRIPRLPGYLPNMTLNPDPGRVSISLPPASHPQHPCSSWAPGSDLRTESHQP